MGCGASKKSTAADKVSPAPEKPVPRKRGSKGSVTSKSSKKSVGLDVVSDAATRVHKARGVKGSARHWLKLSAYVTSGLYTAWDAYELPIVGYEEDYFENFDEDQENYNMFLGTHVDVDGNKVRTDYAESSEVVNWNETLLDKLAKDKTPRGQVLRDAKKYGDTFNEVQNRHITVLYNPVGGGGKARRLVGAMVIPVLQLCKLKFKVMPTKYRRHAVEVMQAMDPNETNGVIVCGGDGLVHEVVTGYFLNPRLEEMKANVPMGVCPCGTANAMANALHTHEDTSQISIVGRAALAACKGGTKEVDVIKCIQQPVPTSSDKSLHGPDPVEIYALSCFGWGMAGAVALKADKLRWIPGQRSMRYDIAGFVSLIKDWPVADKCTLEYREVKEGQDDPSEWKTKELSIINLIVTNMDKLGKKHPIYPGVKFDDGRLVMSYIDATNKVNTRRHVVKLGLAMKHGKHLGIGKGVESVSLREFKITPQEFKSPFNIDGDPHDVSAVHVTCLNKALRLFYLPPDDKIGTIKHGTHLSIGNHEA